MGKFLVYYEYSVWPAGQKWDFEQNLRKVLSLGSEFKKIKNKNFVFSNGKQWG
jgi:hypothetical protein